MSRFALIPVILLNVGAMTNAQESEMVALEKVLNDYMIGGTERNTERLVSAFHPNAMMKFLRDGEYVEVNAQAFFGEGAKPGPPLERTCEIVSLLVNVEVASAVLKLPYQDKAFHDHMTLMKVNEGWKIINKTFFVEVFPTP